MKTEEGKICVVHICSIAMKQINWFFWNMKTEEGKIGVVHICTIAMEQVGWFLWNMKTDEGKICVVHICTIAMEQVGWFFWNMKTEEGKICVIHICSIAMEQVNWFFWNMKAEEGKIGVVHRNNMWNSTMYSSAYYALVQAMRSGTTCYSWREVSHQPTFANGAPSASSIKTHRYTTASILVPIYQGWAGRYFKLLNH